LKGARFAFLSGDIHFSEVQRLEPRILGYETVEITSSSAHSMTFPGRHLIRARNPRQEAVTSTHNVVLLDFNESERPFDFTARSVGWRGQKLFNYDISIQADCAQKVLAAK
jgi:alkaline phosphatase D